VDTVYAAYRSYLVFESLVEASPISCRARR